MQWASGGGGEEAVEEAVLGGGQPRYANLRSNVRSC